jgi:putative phage-type endonuclease
MITDDQRQQRKLGIGGSDTPIILGVSRYKTPYQLYLEKKGILETSDEMTPEQEWGHLLEPVIRDKFARENNITVEVPDTLIHPFYDFMRGNIDGYIKEWDNVLEIKTSGNIDEWGEIGSDYIPMAYLVQIAHYCAIMNVNHGHLAVLIGHYGFKYRHYKYIRDFEIEKMIINSTNEFWNAVKNDSPPPPVNQIDLRMMFPSHKNEKSVNFSNEIGNHLQKIKEVRNKIKELEEIQEENKFHIMEHMKDAECLVDETGRPLVTWKANKKGSRTFLLKGEK